MDPKCGVSSLEASGIVAAAPSVSAMNCGAAARPIVWPAEGFPRGGRALASDCGRTYS